MTKEDAIALIQSKLPQKYLQMKESLLPGDGIAIMTQDVREEDFGWVIFYQSQTHILTHDSDFFLVGAAPFIVNKCDGSVYELSSTKYSEIETAIQQYRKQYSLKC